ncbi:ABC transporter ATP-binding protein [Verminephrobacter aporrectodeae subsp. tuberculatae]|uniref:ABC transporter ATP-binding protein n=1 Tax=Verminephrobacter aporrectodeae TaxID=1110389 RepID=UPI002237483B|nr:ABC transporter ATP-binding protein [Verminephrobacter aporrectodeae]MCW5258140.1 ABC transporter ATP-binding protein [Verminephrobacter aporrectodeae subsp. tuberculatae]
MLRFEGVDLHYGSFRALSDVTLHAAPGELVVLLGANGAGKTSIFMAASGIQRPSAGCIRLENKDITGRRPAQIVASGLVHCPEGRKLFPLLSVRRNLLLGAYLHRRDKAAVARTLDEVFALFPMLAHRQNVPAGSLSGGQQQMVAIGRALLGRPKVLLLDEPSLGLAPLIVRQVFAVIERINQQGTTVLLAEQNACLALAIAHRAYVLERGRIALEGGRDALLHNEAVRAAYIGA